VKPFEVAAGSDPKAKAKRPCGKVIESLPNGLFRVELQTGSLVLAHVTARRTKDFLRLLPGDTVELDLSPLHPGRGRVVAKTAGFKRQDRD
jgi:translation initiation factor IF-1